MRFLVVYNEKDEDSKRVVEEVRSLGVEVVEEGYDFVLSCGGDGTFLKASKYAYLYDKPIIGINVKATLGFLCWYHPDEIKKIIENLKQNKYSLEERFLLEADFRDRVLYAVNDIIIVIRENPKILKIKVSVNGKELTTFRADGVIFSTSTGSTAYNLACGGPLLHPTIDAYIMTPIAAHSLTLRPVVLPRDCPSEVQVWSRGDPILLSADCQENIKIKSGDIVKIKVSQKKLKMVKFDDTKNFFELLNEKLEWH